MMDSCSESVRERAYRLWEKEGRPHGRDLAHWLQAEREMSVAEQPASESAGNSRATDTKAKKRSAPRSRSRKVVN